MMTEMVGGERSQERADLGMVGLGDVVASPHGEGDLDRPAAVLQRLDETADSQVLLVVAPAGYGKSTLVTQWAAGRDPATVAWVRLERTDDDDPARLWSRLVAASQLVGSRIDGSVAEPPAVSSTTKLNHGPIRSDRDAPTVRERRSSWRTAILCVRPRAGSCWAGSSTCCPLW